MRGILLFPAFDLDAEAAENPSVDDFLSRTDFAMLMPVTQRVLELEPL